ncbi:NEDD8 ultimate buster 1-like isoform X1 [Salvelinus alpinus]|uniref:NEDD8 ultimate buster 1-like isoform X1 n=1 Tax=Salvelinus alpinus TaxID=8036 RepID=UPI0039FD4669
MAEMHIQAKLVNLLKQDKIQLWNPPYTTEYNRAGQQPLQQLAVNYAPIVCFSVSEVASALESIRSQAVKRGMGNKTYRETFVATLELLLPKDGKKDVKKKNYLETKLDVIAQDIMARIAEQYGLKYIKLILNGKTLTPEKRLDEQDVKNNSKIMVLRVSEPERKKQMAEEEEKKKTQDQSVQRTQKGFQILSERDGTDDPATTPFLEIADQKGNPLKIPHREKKALILAMGFHEKGRALMKRKQYDAALCHLLQADDQFGTCGSVLLSTVDNYAVLQLDIVWCYRALEALSCLDDGKQRLQRAEDCFLKCYGEQQQRLMQIKGNTGREEVLFLRLYLLQSLLAYLDGNEHQATQKLMRVEDLYGRLCLDPGKMTGLMGLGFSEQEARLGLRACHGNVDEAVLHITHRRQEREEMKQQERERRRRRMEGLATLRELGYSKRDAARALQQADGDMDRAYGILLESTQAESAAVTNHNTELPIDQSKVEQLLYLGFEPEAAEAALKLTGGDVQGATQLLLDNQGVLPPELLSPSPPSSLSEEPSTSSESAGRTHIHTRSGSQGEDPMDVDLVNEVLEDIPRHEEDYLDLTLEEESEVIAQMKSYLHRNCTPSS